MNTYPAFPSTGPGDYNGIPCTTHYQGLSVHDYFVAKAIQGICAAPDRYRGTTDVTIVRSASRQEWIDGIVDAAFDIADAVQAKHEARAKEPPEKDDHG